MMPTGILHRSRDVMMIVRGRVLDADAETYLLDCYAGSPGKILGDLIVPRSGTIGSLRAHGRYYR
jgi:hypothetical protein